MRNQNNEKIVTNKWTRLLIFDDTIKYYFLNLFKFLSSFNNLKINNSENVSTLKYGLNVDFALKLRIYSSSKSFICLKWTLQNLSLTLHTQFNYLT